jgi:hypothetical protein
MEATTNPFFMKPRGEISPAEEQPKMGIWGNLWDRPLIRICGGYIEEAKRKMI